MYMGSKAGSRSGAKFAKQLIFSQLVVTAGLSLLFLFVSTAAVYSALLAGLVAIMPNGLFAYRLFKYSGAQSAKSIVSALYRGEAMKLVITMVFMAVIFRFIPILAWPFFATYILVLMVFWVFLLKIR